MTSEYIMVARNFLKHTNLVKDENWKTHSQNISWDRDKKSTRKLDPILTIRHKKYGWPSLKKMCELLTFLECK